MIRALLGRCWRHACARVVRAGKAGEAAESTPDLASAVARLESRCSLLERTLNLAATTPEAFWLFANRMERMDANMDLHEASRREFHRMRYRFAHSYVAARDVADIASGTGYGSRELRDQGQAKSVVGVDIDPAAVRYAEAHYAGDGVRFMCGSADAIPLPTASVDVVVSFETIEHVADVSRALSEFSRILRPAGQLVLSTPHRWQPGENPHHCHDFDPEILRTALAPWFEALEFYDQNSGSRSPNNRGMPAGIRALDPHARSCAECLLVVGRRRSAPSHAESEGGRT